MGHYDSCYEADDRERERERESERVKKNAADVARVLQLRDERGISLQEARSIVERENLMADIMAARTIDDIKALLLRMAA